MPEEEGPSSSHVLRNVLLGIAIGYIGVSLYFIFEMRDRLQTLEKTSKASSEQIVKVDKAVSGMQSNLRASTEAMAERLGTTEKEISARAAQLQREQRAAEQRFNGITEEHKQAITQVSGEVAGVKTELGGAKTDIANTRTDLEATKKKLETALGDLNIQSGLIARTRDDLETLKHRGDRNYYEFTLIRGGRPTPISTISLQLKKTDAKKGRFTLDVLADDRTIEKKDRNLFEPMQFLSGREKQLFELVVMTVEKNRVTGYLSTPKAAPISVTVPQK